MMRVVLLAALVLGACTPVGASGERGALCWDGKDNDDDGAIDCADSECASLAICRDPRPGDLGINTRPDFGVIPDLDPRRDSGGAKRDTTVDRGVQPSGTKYGDRCPWNGTSVQNCDDGTYCIPAPGSPPGTGYCTHTCSQVPDSCPQPGGGLHSRCLYRFSGVYVCTFVCLLAQTQYPCPPALSCQPLTSSQYHCWP